MELQVQLVQQELMELQVHAVVRSSEYLGPPRSVRLKGIQELQQVQLVDWRARP